MFNNYYQQQLSHLRTRASEFARAHPAIAPLLAEASEDPDVERLHEGTAFLCGMLQQKIDDDFPEYIHNLTEIIFPHLLRPIPSASVITFTPKESLLETLYIPAGTTVSSVPVDGTRCEFRTTMDVHLTPLQVSNVNSRSISTVEEVVTVKCKLSGITLSQWQQNSLQFYIAGDYSQTSSIFMRLKRDTRRIIIRTASGRTITLGSQNLVTPGFGSTQSLSPLPEQTFRGYSLLIDYFAFPEKFCFLEITGLSALKDMGESDSFEIDFVLSSTRTPVEFRKEFFTLFATPVVNLFSHDADPIQVNHQSESLPVLPSGLIKNHYSIYTVDSVIGFLQGMVEKRMYVPFNRYRFHDTIETGVFQVHLVKRADESHSFNISLSYRPNEKLRQEVLSIQLTCSNGHLAERLRVGDISVPTSSSPELATFKNIITPTPFVDVATGKNELWRLLSHVSQNLLSINNAESMREFLHLYTFSSQRTDHRAAANSKRVNAVEEFSTRPVDRIVQNILLRGMHIHLTAADHHFASQGDLYLFGSVLDAFLSMYASMNTFTQYELTNSQTGETFQWPPRLGEKPLI